MSHAFRATVMIAAAAGALLGMAGERLYAQGADPNAALKANRIETTKGPAESGEICSVEVEKIAKK